MDYLICVVIISIVLCMAIHKKTELEGKDFIGLITG